LGILEFQGIIRNRALWTAISENQPSVLYLQLDGLGIPSSIPEVERFQRP
jgi:hypothetical protein